MEAGQEKTRGALQPRLTLKKQSFRDEDLEAVRTTVRENARLREGAEASLRFRGAGGGVEKWGREMGCQPRSE